MTTTSTQAPPMTDEERAEAEEYVLAELAHVASVLGSIEQTRDTLYARRRELYAMGREMTPPIPGSRMARAAGVSDAALVLSAARRKAG